MSLLIKFDNVSYSYSIDKKGASTSVLKNINFTINKGEFISIVGHNGCGKSTLSKMFNALILPTEGKVFVNGMDTSINKYTYDIRKKVGLVFQNPENQIVSGIVEEDVAFGPENLGIESSEIRKRVDEALKITKMYRYRKSSIQKLSGGQKQRVAIAGIITMFPECIVLDEPTSMLDPKGRDEVMETLKILNKRFGITIILVTHFMNEAMLADRVVVMSEGRILKNESPKIVFSNIRFLRENQLDVPQSVDLIEKLKKYGFSFDSSVLTTDECVKAIDENLKGRIQKKEKKNKKELNLDSNKIKKIEMINVDFFYGKGTSFENKALSKINLDIIKGDFVGIIGCTGSGKSTLIQHLNALIKPHSGQVLFDGKDINLSKKTIKQIKFKVGVVFQYPEHQLFGDTVYEDVSFGPVNMQLNKNEIDERVEKAMDFVGLDKSFLNKSPFDLSGGEKRRVAIAGVIAMEPDVLVLDEPTSGLDPFGRSYILKKLKKYHQEKENTVIMVSHSMEDIAKVAKNIIVMKDGEVKSFCNVNKVFSDMALIQDAGLNVPQITKIVSELINLKYPLTLGLTSTTQVAHEIESLLEK